MVQKAKQKSMKREHLGALFILAIVLITSFYILAIKEEGKIRNVEMLEGDQIYPITSQSANYFGNATGYFSKPSQEGKFPGIIMVHEFWGLNNHIKDTADQLAGQGYIVLAVDLYEGQITDNQSRARELVTIARGNQSRSTENMKAALAYLKSQKDVTKLASMGWCFGGGQALQLALSGEELDATVIYYGTLVTNETQLSAISWPVLGVFGSEDTSIPVAQVKEFEAALSRLNIPNSINVYEGVGHAFANPSGMNYAPEETKDAWAKTLAFLAANLK